MRTVLRPIKTADVFKDLRRQAEQAHEPADVGGGHPVPEGKFGGVLDLSGVEQPPALAGAGAESALRREIAIVAPRIRKLADRTATARPRSLASPPSAGQPPFSEWSGADGVTPTGLPVAFVACASVRGAPEEDRTAFIPLLRQTLVNVQAGTWWLSAEERRFHDTELQRLLQHAGAQTTVPADARFAEVAAIAHLVRRFPPSRRDAATRVFERSTGGAFLLVWLPRATDPARWSGVALSEQRLADILEPVLGSLLRGLPFVAAVRDPDDDPLWNPCRSCPRQPGRPCRSAASQSGHRAEDVSVSFPTER